MLFQLLVNRMCSHCLLTTGCWQLATRLLSSTDEQHVIVLQFNKLRAATWWSHSIVTTCWQSCYKVVEPNRLVTSCSNNLLSSCNSTICQQVVSDNLVATWWSNSIVTTCWQSCYKVVEPNRLVTSCSNNLLASCNSTICQEVVSDNPVATWWSNSIVTTCWQARYKVVANTSCWQVVRQWRDGTNLFD
jgi:hypothetical protein